MGVRVERKPEFKAKTIPVNARIHSGLEKVREMLYDQTGLDLSYSQVIEHLLSKFEKGEIVYNSKKLK